VLDDPEFFAVVEAKDVAFLDRLAGEQRNMRKPGNKIKLIS
jgi:hypothetical protein